MNRIAVTGMGVMCALGNNKDEFLEGLRSARNGIRPVASFADIDRYPIQVGCEIQRFALDDFGLQAWADYDPITQRALAAVSMALADANLARTRALENVGLALATCMGGCMSREAFYRRAQAGEAPSQQLIRQVPCAVVAGHVARQFALGGPLSTVVTACAAGTNAIGLGADHIRSGRASVMIAGGVDPFSAISFSGFTVLGAMSKNQASPFSVERTGLVLGEAPAFVILEAEAHALARNAPIYGYVLGYGLSNDAYHPTTPDPSGAGAARAMRAALRDAKLCPEQIAYVNAHGTGTHYNDEMEVRALEEVFGDHAEKLAVSSTKSQIGHTLAAAGAVELITTLLAMKHGFFPATVGCDAPMPAAWDFVPNQARPAAFEHAMSNSFAFGGNTASVVVARA
jgi:3-oxoacyl-[acyl-carrier-protein] synthase II